MLKRRVGRALPAVSGHQMVRRTHPTGTFQSRSLFEVRLRPFEPGFSGSSQEESRLIFPPRRHILPHLYLGAGDIHPRARRQGFTLGALSRQRPGGKVPQGQDPIAGRGEIDVLAF
jgi:hypothetical protein